MQQSLQLQRNKNCSLLPILGYYLTFIHYFGFSINPAATNFPNNNNNNNNSATHFKCTTTKPDRCVQLSKAADWTNETTTPKQQQRSKKWSTFFSFRLQSIIKFTAISFTTFLAINHCLVLADYIYNGSKAYEELMFEARLVLTKLSALIFVLSWHSNQSKVKRLIKMVKSTSIYITGTYGRNTSDVYATIPQQPTPPLTSTANYLWLQGRQRIVADRQGNISDDSSSNYQQQQQRHIGYNLHAHTDRIDRSVLKWWFMCLFVILLHFLLSEVELSKSHHLWQWLDDYSMHQLSNETTSSSTLLFLASFDNYIYTVHVYGTRLIGASIICIVCSLQYENIENLRRHTSHLLKSSKELRVNAATAAATEQSTTSLPLSPPAKHPQYNHFSVVGAVSADNRLATTTQCCCRYNDQNCNYANNHQQQQQQEKVHKQQGESDRNKLLMSDTDSNCSCCFTGGNISSISRQGRFCLKQLNNSGEQERRRATSSSSLSRLDLLENDISCLADCDLFFILGHSNWLKVRENAARLRPCGYLSSSIWRAKHYLSSLLQQQLAATFMKLSSSSCICMRLFRFSKQREPGVQFIKPPTNDQSQVSTAQQAALPETSIRKLSRTLRSRRVTPTLRTCTCTTTFSQVASSLMATTTSSGVKLVNFSSDSKSTTPNNHCDSDSDKLDYNYKSNASDLLRAMQVNNNLYLSSSTSPSPSTGEPVNGSYITPISSSSSSSQLIEQQLENLANKYELVRTVNANIDSCFGQTLLIQYSFLFLMSCIDVVYFSIYFNPSTKTKYIIISGMILLWWPYLLLYKFASDLGSSSKELLISVRRLARLSLIEYHSPTEKVYHNNNHHHHQHHQTTTATDRLAAAAKQQLQLHEEASTANPLNCSTTALHFKDSLLSFLSSSRRRLRLRQEGSRKFKKPSHHQLCRRLMCANGRNTDDAVNLNGNLKVEDDDEQEEEEEDGDDDDRAVHDSHKWLSLGFKSYLRRRCITNQLSPPPLTMAKCTAAAVRVRIINKLDHVFKPTNLSIIGIMTIDKFFLLNFAKIVITASVMIIQFISHKLDS